MGVSAVMASLRERHGEATACKMARLERLKAYRVHSRKRFDFWTAVGDADGTGALGQRTDAVECAPQVGELSRPPAWRAWAGV